MADIRISLADDDPVGGIEALWAWLRDEPELRGVVRLIADSPGAGEMGSASSVLVAALGTGGAVSVLAASLRAFLTQPRRSDVRITVQGPDGRRVEVDAKRVDDAEGLVRQVLGQVE